MKNSSQIRKSIGYLPGSKSFYNDRIFSQKSDDGRLLPFVGLRNHLAAKGINVQTADRTDTRYDFLLIHRIDINAGRLLELLANKKDTRLVYLVTEDEMICPIHTAKALQPLAFDAVLTWREDLIAEGAVPYSYPNPTRRYEAGQPFDERELLVAIAANKSPRAFARNELYTLRRKLFLQLMHDHRFYLYGPGWQFSADTPGTYGGPVESKLHTVSQYRFSLILENTREKGGITEKIFDAMCRGSVPVYLGAPDVADWIPKSCFVDLEEMGIDELCNKLSMVSSERWSEYQSAIRNFLESDNYRRFSEKGFIDAVDKAIERASSSTARRSASAMWIGLARMVINCPQVLFYRGGQKLVFDLLVAPFKSLFKAQP